MHLEVQLPLRSATLPKSHIKFCGATCCPERPVPEHSTGLSQKIRGQRTARHTWGKLMTENGERKGDKGDAVDGHAGSSDSDTCYPSCRSAKGRAQPLAPPRPIVRTALGSSTLQKKKWVSGRSVRGPSRLTLINGGSGTQSRSAGFFLSKCPGI